MDQIKETYINHLISLLNSDGLLAENSYTFCVGSQNHRTSFEINREQKPDILPERIITTRSNGFWHFEPIMVFEHKSYIDAFKISRETAKNFYNACEANVKRQEQKRRDLQESKYTKIVQTLNS